MLLLLPLVASAPLDALVHAPGEPLAVRQGVPSTLYVETNGILVEPCADDNASLRCTSLAGGITVFPAWGTEAERATALQTLGEHYADFGLRITTEPPPGYLPHMLAVVGGTSSLLGHESVSCGLAKVVCGGERRNLVSFTFGASCGGWDDPVSVAAVIAQESAHNLGLEHVNASDDIMFPTLSQVAQTFRDECLEQLTANYDDAYLCPDVHILDCPEVGFQNSHAELLRLLGPRETDPAPVEIVDVSPATDTMLEAGTIFEPTATIDGHEGIGVRWTYVSGPDIELTPGTTRCTNDVCDLAYEAWRPTANPWPFVETTAEPGATYVFRIEAADAFGNVDDREVVLTVEGADSSSSGTDTDAATDTGGAQDRGQDAGCGCTGGPPASPWLLALLPVIAPRSARRRS